MKSRLEVEEKRLQNKLNRDKNPEVKALLAQEDMVNNGNTDLSEKLRAEKEKHDKIMEDRMEAEEKLERMKVKMADDLEFGETQNEVIAELKE